MEPNNLYAFFIVLSVIYTISLLLMGIIITIRSYRLKLNNLCFFGLAAISNVVSQVGNIFLKLDVFFESIFVSLAIFLFLIFTHLTFYKERHIKTARIVLIVGVINYFSICYFGFIYAYIPSFVEFYLYLFQIFIERLIVFGWTSYSACIAYKKIRNRSIQPWIKSRYKILAISSFIMVIQPLSLFFIPYGSTYGDPSPLSSLIVFGVSVIMTLIFVFGIYVAMVMPKRIRNYLNRDYGPSEIFKLADKEITEMIKYLGDCLSLKLKFSPSAARGLLKLAIIDQYSGFKPIEKLTYSDLKLVLNNKLHERIEKLKSEGKVDIEDIDLLINKLKDQLIQGQSLISLSRI
ncbi:MAG: hypothetical protein JW891_13375 [Candidatus Lokiarchaeota archaeon]|nr:hypothetical protein [Candidatus Lokiarchaeota archaeon]